MLVLTHKIGETCEITINGEKVVLHFVDRTGNDIKVAYNASPTVQIHRVKKGTKNDNQSSSNAKPDQR